MNLLFVLLVLTIFITTSINGFLKPGCRYRTLKLKSKYSDAKNENENEVKVGTKEYYIGFLETPLEDQRSDGLEQTLKLGGSVAGILVLLTFAFLKSNDLL